MSGLQSNPIFMMAALAGAVGLWLMLPRPSARGRALGVVLAAVSVGVLAALVDRLGDWVSDSLFFLLSGITVASATATITFKNPLHSAIWFGMTLLGTAGLFLFQGAQFLAVATIVVYAGAILVTFLFVLMLAQPRGQAPYDRVSWETMVSAASGAVMVGILSMTVTSVLASVHGPQPAEDAEIASVILADEHVAHVGAELMGRHLIAIEVAGVLLLAALVGAAVIVAQSRDAQPAGESGDTPAEPGTTAEEEPRP